MMENNIFENAYFGKAYKTRSGEKAIYWLKDDYNCGHELRTYSCVILVDNEGFIDFEHLDMEHPDDIISEWTNEDNPTQQTNIT